MNIYSPRKTFPPCQNTDNDNDTDSSNDHNDNDMITMKNNNGIDSNTYKW